MKTVNLLLAFSLFIQFSAVAPASAATPQNNPPSNTGKSLDDLTALAKAKDPAKRRDAAAALAKLGPTAIPALTGMLKDGDITVSWAAVEALSGMGPAAIPAVSDQLHDKEIGPAAAVVLGRIGPAAVPPLIALLDDKDPTVRLNAVIARRLHWARRESGGSCACETAR